MSSFISSCPFKVHALKRSHRAAVHVFLDVLDVAYFNDEGLHQRRVVVDGVSAELLSHG